MGLPTPPGSTPDVLNFGRHPMVMRRRNRPDGVDAGMQQRVASGAADTSGTNINFPPGPRQQPGVPNLGGNPIAMRGRGRHNGANSGMQQRVASGANIFGSPSETPLDRYPANMINMGAAAGAAGGMDEPMKMYLPGEMGRIQASIVSGMGGSMGVMGGMFTGRAGSSPARGSPAQPGPQGNNAPGGPGPHPGVMGAAAAAPTNPTNQLQGGGNVAGMGVHPNEQAVHPTGQQQHRQRKRWIHGQPRSPSVVWNGGAFQPPNNPSQHKQVNAMVTDIRILDFSIGGGAGPASVPGSGVGGQTSTSQSTLTPNPNRKRKLSASSSSNLESDTNAALRYALSRKTNLGAKSKPIEPVSRPLRSTGVRRSRKPQGRVTKPEVLTDSEILQSILKDLSHLVIPPYRLKKDAEIGVGGYGAVYSALLTGSPDKSARKVAVKELRIVEVPEVRRRIATRLVRELKVWSTANHPNILELVGFYLSENVDCAHFVSGYMAYGNVKVYIEKYEPNMLTRLKFVQGLTSGINYLHTCDPPICHGDLKPYNVLVDDNIEAVLCDFGLATFIDESGASSGLTTSKSVKGSTRYMSPELFKDSAAKHTCRSDMWAWACTAFEVLTDCQPYATATVEGSVIWNLIQGVSPGEVGMLDALASGEFAPHDAAPSDLASDDLASDLAPDDTAPDNTPSDDLNSYDLPYDVLAPGDHIPDVLTPDVGPMLSLEAVIFDDPAPDDIIPDDYTACRRTLDSLKPVILECWNSDSAKRPSSSEIINRVFFQRDADTSDTAW